MFDELVPQGFRPVVVNGAGVGGQVRYAAIFEKGRRRRGSPATG